MQKVQAIVYQPDVDRFLATLQQFGAMEFTELADESLTELSIVAPHTALLPKLQHAISFLAPYQKKRGLLQLLREGATIGYTEADVAKRMSDTDVVRAVVADVEALQVELAEKTERVRQLEEQRALLKTWSPVTNRLSELTTGQTISILVSAGQPGKLQLTDLVSAACGESVATYGIEQVSQNAALLTILTSDLKSVTELLTDADLPVITRPQGVETAAIELVAVEEKLAAAKGELGITHDQADHVAHTHLSQLHITGELLEWERDRFSVLDSARGTATTAVFSGWLVADQKAAIEAALAEKKLSAVFMDQDQNEAEEPPVEIRNSAWVQPFEAVTRLYGMPGHKDLDPTLFLAGFFFLFFGLSLTDVGYGATLIVISAGLLVFAKLTDSVRSMMKLLLYIGFATVLVGMLFGGYFGIAPELLPAWMQAIQVFDPIGNPLPVFYLALGLGVFQVMVGMVLKIYSDARNQQLLQGVLEQGPWLFLFCVGILYVLSIAGYVAAAASTITALAYVGLAVLIGSALARSRSIVEALMNVGGSLYASVGYLSDILSYSRLLALGLATTALAFAINLIAGIVYDSVPYLGPVFALMVLFIGHVFTLAVNTLGAFIHSARLQFVEFFGKFVAGTGRSFAPLARTEKHITVAKE